MMTLAQVICGYPREVAVQACSPVHGVPKRHKDFKPTAGQVRQWCEDESEGIYERAKLETKRLPPPQYDQSTVEERKSHVERVLARLGSKLSRPTSGRQQPGWITPAQAAEILARHEREANQNQTLDEEQL